MELEIKFFFWNNKQNWPTPYKNWSGNSICHVEYENVAEEMLIIRKSKTTYLENTVVNTPQNTS